MYISTWKHNRSHTQTQWEAMQIVVRESRKMNGEDFSKLKKYSFAKNYNHWQLDQKVDSLVSFLDEIKDACRVSR